MDSLLDGSGLSRSHLTLVHSAPAAGRVALDGPGRLSARDMMVLHGWMRRSELHGYSRLVIELGDGSGAPEQGGYALVYEPMQDWASWGVVRDGDEVVVWHCGTGADRGRHASMQSALESLPVLWHNISRTRDVALGRDARSTVVRLA